MQIIQGIRDKGAAIVIAVIALSLIGFILMDAKGSGNRLFGASSTSVGRWRGSALMAKPNSINCTMGRPIIMAKVTRSRRIWMNSLTSIA